MTQSTISAQQSVYVFVLKLYPPTTTSLFSNIYYGILPLYN